MKENVEIDRGRGKIERIWEKTEEMGISFPKARKLNPSTQKENRRKTEEREKERKRASEGQVQHVKGKNQDAKNEN